MRKVQHARQNASIDACEAVVRESGATNFDAACPVLLYIFVSRTHVAPDLPAIIQAPRSRYPSVSTADHAREASRARQSKEDEE